MFSPSFTCPIPITIARREESAEFLVRQIMTMTQKKEQKRKSGMRKGARDDVKGVHTEEAKTRACWICETTGWRNWLRDTRCILMYTYEDEC